MMKAERMAKLCQKTIPFHCRCWKTSPTKYRSASTAKEMQEIRKKTKRRDSKRRYDRCQAKTNNKVKKAQLAKELKEFNSKYATTHSSSEHEDIPSDDEKRELLSSCCNMGIILAEMLKNVPGKAWLMAYHKCWLVAYDAVADLCVQSVAEPQQGMVLCNDGEDFRMEAAEMEG